MIGLGYLRPVILCRLAAWLAFTGLGIAQTGPLVPLVPTTTSITSSSQALLLPGSLTLSSTVAAAGETVCCGVPTGNLVFNTDGVAPTPLGSAPLAIVPGTQTMLTGPNFELSYPFLSAGYPTGLAMGAFLHDGHNDLAVTDSGDGLPQFFRGQGQSQFILQSVTVSNAPTNLIEAKGIATGDFTGNGTADLVFFALTDGDNPTVVDYVYLNQGNGTFNAVLNQDESGCDCTGQVSFDAESITVGNFDANKLNDIAYISNPPASTESPASLGIALNAGNGSFPTFTPIALPNGTPASPDTFLPTAITSGTFDGHVDLVVAGTYQNTSCTIPGATGTFNGYVAIYPGDGNGNFGTPRLFCAGENPSTLAVGDFNKDSNLDVLVGNSGFVSPASPTLPVTVQVLLGDGKGGLSAGQTILPPSYSLSDGFTSPGNLESLAVADFDADAYPDFAVLDGYGTLYFYSNGGNSSPGEFRLRTSYVTTDTGYPPSGFAAAAGDVNSDGYPDLVSFVSSLNQPLSSGFLFVFTDSASAQASSPTPQKSLQAGVRHVSASFAGDSNFMASPSTAIAVTVSQTVPSITWNPEPVTYPNGLASAQLDATTNPAFDCPSCFAYTPGSGVVLPLSPPASTLTVIFTPPDSFDYASATASTNVSVGLPAPNVTVNVPTTASPGGQPAIALTLDSYPVVATVNITLGFTPSSTNPPMTNGSVKFPDGTTTHSVMVAAGNTVPIPPIMFSAGVVAGTVTVSFTVTAGGLDVTPANLTAPVSITVQPSVPAIQSVTLNCSTTPLQLIVKGYSSTREISAAEVSFSSAPGKSLQTSTFPIMGAQQLFTSYYLSGASDAGGSTFTLTQPFTLSSGTSSDIGGVSVALTNGQGQTQSSTAQCTN